MFGVRHAVNMVNSARGHCGVIVLFIGGNQAGWLLTSVMRLRQMRGAGGKDKASWHGGRVYLNKEVNLEIQRQNNGQPL